jgi:hypothetical protein
VRDHQFLIIWAKHYVAVRHIIKKNNKKEKKKKGRTMQRKKKNVKRQMETAE